MFLSWIISRSKSQKKKEFFVHGKFRQGFYLIQKHATCFKSFLALGYDGVPTQNLLGMYFHQRWKRLLKTRRVPHPSNNRRCPASCKTGFALPEVPPHVSSTSSPAFENLETWSIMHSTDICSCFTRSFFLELSVHILKCCYLGRARW